MKKSAKIIYTGIIVFIWLLLNALVQASAGPGGINPGMFGVVIMIGMILSIRAIWKKRTVVTDSDTEK